MSPSEKGSVNIAIARTTLPDSTPVHVRIKNPPSEITSTSIRINETTGVLDISASKVGIYDLTLVATGGGYRKEIPLSVEIKKIHTTVLKETVVTGLEVPWDLTFTPDGTLYFTERKGTFNKLVDRDVVTLTHPLDVWSEKESGPMGIDFDPDYSAEPYLYVCYSYRLTSGEIKNRVSRLVVEDSALTDEDILIDEIPGGTNHDGCRIVFAPDKTLYITMGDARVSENAQLTNSLSGKMLRINSDGSIPEDNPFDNAVWSYGHRNAQGLAFHSNGKLYSSEHGDADEDEINIVEKESNYGWPYVEGLCNTDTEIKECEDRNLVEPITVFTPTIAVSGLAFYSSDLFSEWKGGLLLASLKAGQLYHLALDENGEVSQENLVLDNTYGRLRDVEVAPDGSIYIATSNQDGRGVDDFLEQPDRIIRWSKE